MTSQVSESLRPSDSFEAVLSLGANLGDRRTALQYAVGQLNKLADWSVVAESGLYVTEPKGGPPQPDFLNQVVILAQSEGSRSETSVAGWRDEGRALLAECHRIESERDRVREIRWGPRTLDIDVLAMGHLMLDFPDLQVPHPRLAERAFVLVPWAEIRPDCVVPGQGMVVDLLANLPLSERDSVQPWSGDA